VRHPASGFALVGRTSATGPSTFLRWVSASCLFSEIRVRPVAVWFGGISRLVVVCRPLVSIKPLTAAAAPGASVVSQGM